MTILPGSLDYLYYNGILEHIPYEAYEMVMASPTGSAQNNLEAELLSARNMKKSGYSSSNMNSFGAQGQYMQNNDYLNTAKKGQMYGYYGSSSDSFNDAINYQQAGVQPQTKMHGGSENRRIKIFDKRGRNSEAGVYNKYDRQLQNGEYDDRKMTEAEMKDSKEGVLNSHPALKGILATIVFVATPILFIRGLIKHRRPKSPPPPKTRKWNRKKQADNNLPKPYEPVTKKKSFWSKLNPKNWFK